ncbi:MAG TPA: cupin domain-containing protein [Caulobacteraceae bacterium]|jgi:quercetin dioxygenase-like cupin family protein|nr:cupin domain-containing protein [Caulobacteraceae bacterium]
MEKPDAARRPVVVQPDQGRAYAMGPMRAIFKADGDETAAHYSVSEWWLEPRTRGPGVHEHAEDHVFFVITGTLSLCVDGQWLQLERGGYVVIPGGAPHDFGNRGSTPAGFIAFTSPGGFEEHMPDIASALGAEDLRM